MKGPYQCQWSLFILGIVGLRFNVLTSVALPLSVPAQPEELIQEIGYFWQVTDIHYDPSYTEYEHEPVLCLSGGNSSLPKNQGKFGDFSCDSPWALAVSAIYAMGNIKPAPDFIIWTGDNLPHVPDSALSERGVYTELKNLTMLLKETFSDVLVFPTLGNHDSWKANLLPTRNTSYYLNFLQNSGFGDILPEECHADFQKGGYYHCLINDKLVHIGLNTMLWYRWNSLAYNISDPSAQFTWLEQALSRARHKKQKVIISSHVPPGVPGRKPSPSGSWLDFHTTRFLNIMENFADIVAATMFAHEHTDSYRIMYDKYGSPAIPMYLAPAVTPRKGTVKGTTTNNPAIRLYKYDRSTGAILDIIQYYLDLVQANKKGVAEWAEEYSFMRAYKLPDASAESLQALTDSFKNPFDDNFKKYFLYNSVKYDNFSECNGSCVWFHICAAEYIEFAAYKKCMIDHGNDIFDELQNELNNYALDNNNRTHIHPPHHHKKHVPNYMLIVIVVLVVIVILLFIIITILCMQQRRHMVVFHSKTRAGYIPVDTGMLSS